jgi:hypothetical protein
MVVVAATLLSAISATAAAAEDEELLNVDKTVVSLENEDVGASRAWSVGEEGAALGVCCLRRLYAPSRPSRHG